jgi:hypothetical protein
LAGNAAVRPTFTEVGHLTAFVVGLAAIPLTPDRDHMTYPSSALLGTGGLFQVPVSERQCR